MRIGIFVFREEIGEVGDLIVDTVKAGCISVVLPAFVVPGSSLIRLCFRFRAPSSLLSLMRGERRVSGISSEDDDDVTRCRWCSRRTSRPMILSRLSVSESDIASSSFTLLDLPLLVLAASGFCTSPLSMIAIRESGDPERPSAWAVERAPLRRGMSPVSFRMGENGESFPVSFRKPAITYVPGNANVENIHLSEAARVTASRFAARQSWLSACRGLDSAFVTPTVDGSSLVW